MGRRQMVQNEFNALFVLPGFGKARDVQNPQGVLAKKPGFLLLLLGGGFGMADAVDLAPQKSIDEARLAGSRLAADHDARLFSKPFSASLMMLSSVRSLFIGFSFC